MVQCKGEVWGQARVCACCTRVSLAEVGDEARAQAQAPGDALACVPGQLAAASELNPSIPA